ncbi:MAG: phosphoethanolamine--lipid A transferase [Methylococcales bacterium]|nr:phosphoethanolamine--lipid A transferase [Methylococcales bacterium]
MNITPFKLICMSSFFLVTFYNQSFFKAVLNSYPLSWKTAGFISSLTIALFCFIVLLLTLLSAKKTLKISIISLLMISSFSSYFMDSYHLVIDDNMIQNIIETNLNESLDLFSFNLVLYTVLLGILPAIFIVKVNIQHHSLKIECIHKLKVIIGVLVISLILFFSFSKAYLSFIREHKPIRYYINPLYYLYSTGQYINRLTQKKELAFKKISQNAQTPITDNDRELVILVVGETARADRFSFNGYHRETNPLLKKERIINLPNMSSCGTSTATSVPCLFSVFTRENYEANKAFSTENVLDVLQHAGASVLWRDNNSDSKGVALRVPYEDYKTPQTNTICDSECRDEGMLVGLQAHINKTTNKDILIVLHQMGSHGPAYYKRYPKRFEKFKPVCKTNQLEQCTTDEINNAYDNTILYTDYFLSKVIALLKQNSAEFETAMFYVSDHGESLGEKGLYLHGLPYFMAPKEQTHVASLLWFGKNYKIEIDNLKKEVTQAYSHDHVFHTLLGLMETKISVYDKNLDIIGNHQHHYH